MPKPSNSENRPRLRIGYLVADPSVDFAKNAGCRIHVEHIVMGLRSAQHEVRVVIDQPEGIWSELPSLISDRNRPNNANASGRRSYKAMHATLRRLCHLGRLPCGELIRIYRVYKSCIQVFGNCDLIHERFALYSLGGVLAARRLGLPLVLEVNAPLMAEAEAFGGGSFRATRRLLAIVSAKMCFRMSKAVIVVSANLGNLVMSQGGVDPEKIYVLPNAADVEVPVIDPEAKQLLGKQYGLGSSPIVVFVGALQPWHGLDNLLEAFAIVLKTIPSAKLLIVGDGSMRQRSVEKSNTLGIQQSVIFTGNVDHSKVPEFLSVSDVAVAPYPRLPLDFYFSPLKLFEYMAAGKAIVASRLGQIAEVLTNGTNGLLVEPGDVGELAKGIIRLLTDDALRQALGTAAQETVRQNYTWPEYIRKLVYLYESVLGEAV